MFRNEKIKWIKCVGVIILIAQLVAVSYINLTQLKYHIGYDASINYLKTMEIWKQHKVIIDHWVATTGYALLDVNILAVPFYAITGNVFTSFGIANLLVISMTMWSLNKVFDAIDLQWSTKLLGFNFYLCPFVTVEYNTVNDLGYASNMLWNTSFYSITMLLVFLSLAYLWNDMSKKKTIVVGVILTIFITLLNATVGLVLWALFLVPICLSCFMQMFFEESLNLWRSKEFIWGMINVILSPVANVLFSNGASQSMQHIVKLTRILATFRKHSFGIIKFFGMLSICNGYFCNVIFGLRKYICSYTSWKY